MHGTGSETITVPCIQVQRSTGFYPGDTRGRQRIIHTREQCALLHREEIPFIIR